MTNRCEPFPELVGARCWLPPEGFEFGWATPVGCNNLRCRRCGEPVRSEVLPDGVIRRYACACQRKDVAWSYQIDGEPDDLYPAFTGWACDGHPEFLLPATLDGVRLDDVGTDWKGVASVAILHPPFEPPGVTLRVVWLVRLYRLLDARRTELGRAVSGMLDAEDSRLVRGALDFLLTERSAPGSDRIADVLTGRREWLAHTPDPRYPSYSLLQTAADLLYERLLDAMVTRAPIERRDLAVGRELALAGIGPPDAPLAFSRHDPSWLWANVGNLARANEGWVSTLVRAAIGAAPGRRRMALRELAGISPELVRKAVEQHVREPERSELLASIWT